jgi:hypothetical protein
MLRIVFSKHFHFLKHLQNLSFFVKANKRRRNSSLLPAVEIPGAVDKLYPIDSSMLSLLSAKHFVKVSSATMYWGSRCKYYIYPGAAARQHSYYSLWETGIVFVFYEFYIREKRCFIISQLSSYELLSTTIISAPQYVEKHL